MKQNNLIWANRYGRTGELKSSTPFQSFEDAIRYTEEVVEVFNKSVPDKYRLSRKGAFLGGDNGGYTIRIEKSGSPFLYVRDAWVGISANYTEYIPKEDWFINLLLGWFGINTGKLVEFAEQFYAQHLERIFCEDYLLDIQDQ